MLCFRKILVAKKYMDKREGEVLRFPMKFFLSHSAEKCRRGPFSLSLISGIEKVWMRGCGGGGRRSVKIFRRKFLVSQCRKIS